MGKNSYAVAMAYCGAIIGAGFATGREVVDFFSVYGRWGCLGGIWATLLFVWAGITILDVAHRHAVYSYLDLLGVLLPRKWLVVFVDSMFLATLIVGVGVMTAAGGTVLGDWGLGYSVGCAGFLAVCILFLCAQGEGFIRANCWLVPGMALVMALLCLAQICSPVLMSCSRGPLSSALLYVSFNTAIAGVALSTLKSKLDRRTVIFGGLGGGLLVGGLLLLVQGATVGLHSHTIPLLRLAEIWLGKWHWLYALVLLSAVLTTALANLHGLARRMAEGRRYWLWVVVASLSGFAIAQQGFVRLVAILYPMLGLCNIVLLVGLCYYSVDRFVTSVKNRWWFYGG